MELHQRKKRKIMIASRGSNYAEHDDIETKTTLKFGVFLRREEYQAVLRDAQAQLMSLQEEFSQVHRTVMAIHHPMREVATLLDMIRRHFQPTMAEVLKMYARQVCVHKSRMLMPRSEQTTRTLPMQDQYFAPITVCTNSCTSSAQNRPELTWKCPECLFENDMLSPLFPQCRFGHNRRRCGGGNFHMWKCTCGLVRRHNVMQDPFDHLNPPRCWNDYCPGVMSAEWHSFQTEQLRRRKELMEVRDAQEKIARTIKRVLNLLRTNWWRHFRATLRSTPPTEEVVREVSAAFIQRRRQQIAAVGGLGPRLRIEIDTGDKDNLLDRLSGLYHGMRNPFFKAYSYSSGARVCPGSLVYKRPALGECAVGSSSRGVFYPTLHCFEKERIPTNGEEYTREWARVIAQGRSHTGERKRALAQQRGMTAGMSGAQSPEYQLKSFFTDFPGLRKYIGSIMLMYYTAPPITDVRWCLGSMADVGRGDMRTSPGQDPSNPCVRAGGPNQWEQWNDWNHYTWKKFRGRMSITDVTQSPVDPSACVDDVRDLYKLMKRLFESDETGLMSGRVSGSEKRLRPVRSVLEFLNVVQ